MVPVRWFVPCVAALWAASGCTSSSQQASSDGDRDAQGAGDIHSPEWTTDGGRADALKPADEAGIDGGADSDAAPTETTLTLSLPLVPAFSPSIHDYYVRCPAANNAVTLTMTAAPGSAVGLLQPFPTAPSPKATLPLEVAVNSAIVLDVTKGSAVEEYWVRCLPASFPEMTMTRSDAGAPTPGYYLVGNTMPGQGVLGYAMVLDGNGVPVWYRTTTLGAGVMEVDSVVPGTISFILDAASQKFDLFNLATATTSYVNSVGGPTEGHELRYLPNGDYLVLSNPVTDGVDLSELGFGANAAMLGCVVEEISPTGMLVWQWDVTDHFDPVQDCTFPQGDTIGNTSYADPFHCNSIDVDPSGDLLISARNMDSIFLVDRTTGVVLWKMGGATYSKDGAPYIAVTNDPLTSFYRQHDARLLADGTISMFDDQTALPGPARAAIYAYDVAAGTASLTWQYPGPAPSTGMGSFRTTSDGSRVIGWGVSGSAGRGFTELDPQGNDVLDLNFPAGDYTYRAIKVPTSTFDLDVLRGTAGGR